MGGEWGNSPDEKELSRYQVLFALLRSLVEDRPVTPPAPPPEETSDCRILPAFLLAFIFGIFGAHRFYVGKTGTAVLQLFTFGGLGIWATIDWILIVCRAFKDKKGRRITKWT